MDVERRDWRFLLASAALGLMAGAAAPSHAQAAGDAAQLERRLEQSVKMIEALAARVEQLERQLANAKAGQSGTPGTAQRSSRRSARPVTGSAAGGRRSARSSTASARGASIA